MAERYNGWTNYETWLVKLWIDNSEGDAEYWQERAEEAVRDTRDESCPDGAAIRELAGDMQSSFETWMDESLDLPAGVFRDLLTGALGSVNWSEIARAFIDDLEPADVE